MPPEAWFDAAAAHLKSARLVINSDPSGAFTLAWAAIHNTAKGIAAVGGARLEGETHGKIVDFLCCVFDSLTNTEKGLVRRASTDRNSLSYDDPRLFDRRVCNEILALAEKLLAAARSGTQPKVLRKIPATAQVVTGPANEERHLSRVVSYGRRTAQQRHARAFRWWGRPDAASMFTSSGQRSAPREAVW